MTASYMGYFRFLSLPVWACSKCGIINTPSAVNFPPKKKKKKSKNYEFN
jgi:hypothetical protein